MNKPRIRIPAVRQGEERQWVQCRTCKLVGFYDFVPYSLGNPIRVLGCGHTPVGSRDLGADRITADVAVPLYLEQVARRVAGSFIVDDGGPLRHADKWRLERRGDERCIVDDAGVVAVVFGDDSAEAKALLRAAKRDRFIDEVIRRANDVSEGLEDAPLEGAMIVRVNKLRQALALIEGVKA